MERIFGGRRLHVAWIDRRLFHTPEFADDDENGLSLLRRLLPRQSLGFEMEQPAWFPLIYRTSRNMGPCIESSWEKTKNA